jgi:hypothetical protein
MEENKIVAAILAAAQVGGSETKPELIVELYRETLGELKRQEDVARREARKAPADLDLGSGGGKDSNDPTR